MLVVVGGQCRKVGKTSVVTSLIQAIPEARWTAIKISTHEHDSHAPYVLSEELQPGPDTDSARYLEAGAERSWWLRCRADALASARGALEGVLRTSRNAILESNSVLNFVQPDLFLMVLDSDARELKPSARQCLHRADAIVMVDRGGQPSVEPPRDILLFKVFPGQYASKELREFFRRRVATSREK